MSSNVWWSDVGQGNVCSKSVGGNLILVGKKIFGGYDENSSANWTVLKFLPWKSLWSWSISTHPWPVVVKSSTGWGCDPNIEPSLPSVMKVWSRCHRSKSSAYLSKHLYIDQSTQCFCLDFFLHISSHVVYSAPTSLTPPPPLPPTPAPLSPCVPQFWTGFDLAVMDCCCVHSSFAGHLSPSWSQERGKKKKNEAESRRRDGFIDVGLALRSMHHQSGSWWMMRPLGVRDNFIQALGHTFIWAGLTLMHGNLHSHGLRTFPLPTNDLKLGFPFSMSCH